MGDDEVLATSNGFIQCLRMLAEEASILRLDQTSAALQRALDTCHLEVATASPTGCQRVWRFTDLNGGPHGAMRPRQAASHGLRANVEKVGATRGLGEARPPIAV